MTMGTIRVPIEEASRFGIVNVSPNYEVTDFVEKPANPPSNLANMGVYVFNMQVLDRALWADHNRRDSSHDFGKDIIPRLVANKARILAYPYTGYWVDVGTLSSYWQAHMDLLKHPPAMDLNNRSWIIHTKTEERPPVYLARGAQVSECMLSHGCVIEEGAIVSNSILSPGVRVCAGATIKESIILNESVIGGNASVVRAILDKQVRIGEGAQVGLESMDPEPQLATIGKASMVPPGGVIEAGATIATDVILSDYLDNRVGAGQTIQTRRLPNEL
jgi:glucose-1-phosphate adenylyltransferase